MYRKIDFLSYFLFYYDICVPQKIDMTSTDHDALLKNSAYISLFSFRLNRIIIKASLT